MSKKSTVLARRVLTEFWAKTFQGKNFGLYVYQIFEITQVCLKSDKKVTSVKVDIRLFFFQAVKSYHESELRGRHSGVTVVEYVAYSSLYWVTRV